MIIFQSFKRFIAFFSMELLIGHLRTFPLEVGVRWIRVRTQRKVIACDGGGCQIFVILVRTY